MRNGTNQIEKSGIRFTTQSELTMADQRAFEKIAREIKSEQWTFEEQKLITESAWIDCGLVMTKI